MTEVDAAVIPERAIDLVVLVPGMHRSGTSAVTGTLHRLGVPAAGTSMPATSDNPRGYYESVAVMAFHDAFLAATASHWTDPEPIAPDLFQTAEGARWTADLAALIATDLLAAGRAFSVKDPRLCRLIPLWRAALARLGATPRVLIPLRHPQAVAASLRERDGMDEGRALSLWLTHVLETERNTRDLVRAFVVYDRLLDDPLPTVERLLDQLAVREHIDLATTWSSVQDFLTDELRHHRPDGLGDPVGPAQLAERCWASLQPLLASPYDLGAMHGLDLIRRALDSWRGGGGAVTIARTRETKVLKTAAQPAPTADRERLAVLETRLDAAIGELGALRSSLGQTERTLDETRKPLWRIRGALSKLRRRTVP